MGGRRFGTGLPAWISPALSITANEIDDEVNRLDAWRNGKLSYSATATDWVLFRDVRLRHTERNRE